MEAQSVKDTKSPKIMLGGKLRTIQFDMNAFIELENRYGTIQKALEELQSGKMQHVRNMLWTGLIHDEAVIDSVTGEPTSYNITPFQVGQWISNPQMMTQVSELLTQAISSDLPDPEHIVAETAPNKKVQAKSDPTMAQVVLSAEERVAKEQEAKNGNSAS